MPGACARAVKSSSGSASCWKAWVTIAGSLEGSPKAFHEPRAFATAGARRGPSEACPEASAGAPERGADGVEAALGDEEERAVARLVERDEIDRRARVDAG